MNPTIYLVNLIVPGKLRLIHWWFAHTFAQLVNRMEHVFLVLIVQSVLIYLPVVDQDWALSYSVGVRVNYTLSRWTCK